MDTAGFNDNLELDPQGRPVILGFTRSTDLPVTQHAWDSTHSLSNPQQDDANSNDVFVAILTADLTGLVYASYINSIHQDGIPPAELREEPSGLAVDILGNIYASGETISPGFPVTGNAFDSTISTSGLNDCFILKLFPGISTPSMLLYSSFFGGNVNEAPLGVPAIEPGNRGRGLEFIRTGVHRGKVLIGGSTTTSDFPTTAGVVFADWLVLQPGNVRDEQQGFVTVHDAN